MRLGHATIVVGDFEWDIAKEAASRRKHGVSFREALTAFADDRAITASDKDDPARFVLIGMSGELRVLLLYPAK